MAEQYCACFIPFKSVSLDKGCVRALKAESRALLMLYHGAEPSLLPVLQYSCFPLGLPCLKCSSQRPRVHNTHTHTHQKRTSDPLIQAVPNNLTWVLGTENGSSVRAVLSFHFRAISSASSPLISFQNFSHRNFQYVFYLGYRSF